ncbi:ATP-binding protein [Azohydromonas lata]|uniref:Winged helix-turn-helix domain-containing protein n=1 Tax=Azohydromonas lata TaxID=45677 RepID=A0ABU5IRK7_9BURK|nr:winged helix-turn-helix domain-containing protein [Azohydromonas lata]MDZ5461532.1 winged helix-turn-helix domain-containing protein [Azohydromonas lata]
MQPVPPPNALPAPPRIARFGPFQLVPARRRLLLDGEPVRLSDRALDLLVALVEQRGEVVSKPQMLQRGWPGLVVEESNLRVQIAALRRALRDPRDAPRFIMSVPGRGYAFVADVAWTADEGEAAQRGAAAAPSPAARAAPAQPLVGRDDFVAALQYELALRRFITVIGPGGMGKTAVARLVAARSASRYADGVQLLDLATLAGADLVLPHLASRLRVPATGAGTLAALVEHLRHRHLLLVLDNCEHVVDAVCTLAQALREQCEGVDVLATSREALRAAGEYVKRLPPLAVPPAGQAMSAEQALDHAALRLLVERIQAQDVRLSLDEGELALLGDICRRLDGLPLALELAASWVPVLGLAGVALLLDQRLSRLGGGARDAPPRHRSLAAAIASSYDTLDAGERALFRQLGAFRGSFTLAAVESVCRLRGGEAAACAALSQLGRLVDKSLVSVELAEVPPRYRLYESLRRYALEQLHDLAEWRAASQAHASQVLAHCEGLMRQHMNPSWPQHHGGDMADIRAALAWALGPDGDAPLAMALVRASEPLWTGLLLVDEWRVLLERALAQARDAGREGEGDAAWLQMHLAGLQALEAAAG